MDITIKYPSHNDLVQWYYQLAQIIAESAGVTPEEVNALIDAYIKEHPYPVVPADIITASNAAQNVVTSVNGEKGDVTVTGGGDVPGNVVTTDNIAETAVTSFNGAKGAVTGVSSVNGQTGAVTVPGVPDNVITTDNLGAFAVLTFNGQSGYVTGVSSVNGQAGADISLTTSISGGVEVNIGGGMRLRIANITMAYGVGGTNYYAGIFPKDGATNMHLLISATFMTDPSPFTPAYVGLDQSEGVWTIIIGGLSSGTPPAAGTTATACVMAIVS